MISTNDFSARRNAILADYEKVKNDLTVLNDDIQVQIESNENEMQKLAQQNKELASLQTSNKSTINVISKMFK